MIYSHPEERLFRQFDILRRIALEATAGEKPAAVTEWALKEACRLVNLSSGSLFLWDEQGAPTLSVSYAESAAEKELVLKLEEDLFSGLRRQRQMVSAYMSFGGEKPLAAFTQPLRKAGKVYGAVIGIHQGERSLAGEDMFLETLAAALSTAFIIGTPAIDHREVDKTVRQERLKAIKETAATVNHEINNPLTAVLGNIQLLLMRSDELDESLLRKLKIVEESALRIRDVTRKLMNITSDSVTEYIPGSKMLDLSEDEKTL